MKTHKNHRAELAQEIMELIPRVMRSFSAILRSEEANLDPAQIRLLGMLSRGPCNLSAIARQHSVSLPTVSKSVSHMENRGWVKRARSEEDRRVVFLELTVEGRRAWQRITATLQSNLQERLDVLAPDQLDYLRGGLAMLELVFCTDTGIGQGANKNGCN